MENLKFQWDFLDHEPDVEDCTAIGLATQVVIDRVCERFSALMKCGCKNTCKPKAEEEADWLYTKPSHHDITRSINVFRRWNRSLPDGKGGGHGTPDRK